MHKNPTHKPSDSAFSLVEILIVVVILGILSGVLVSLIHGKTAEARAVTLDQQFQRIQQAVALYEQQHGRLPDRLSDLAPAEPTDPPAQATADDTAAAPMVTLRETTDPWGNPFVYGPGPSGVGYSLLSYGSDGVPGGTGEARDETR